jgi:hypothetical protein
VSRVHHHRPVSIGSGDGHLIREYPGYLTKHSCTEYESTAAMPMTEAEAIDTATAVLLQLGAGLVFALVSG